MIESPILLITFNRPDTTQKVFDVIKKAKPSKLYVFNDGPRPDNHKDLKAREEIKTIINKVDWECKLFTDFSEKNLGCGLGVSGAITWAFENEDRLIILEDDCVPSLSFFDYCDYCLEKYKNDNRVMQVAGNNYTENHNYTNDDYLFSKYGHIWGWATWKRAWINFNYEMKEWPIFRDNGNLLNITNSKQEHDYLRNIFNSYYYDCKKPWAIRWVFVKIKMGGITIVPRINLVKNIGYIGTHSKGKFKYHVNLDDSLEIRNEPLFVLCNKQYDEYHFKNHIYKTRNIIHRGIRKIRKIIGNIKVN